MTNASLVAPLDEMGRCFWWAPLAAYARITFSSRQTVIVQKARSASRRTAPGQEAFRLAGLRDRAVRMQGEEREEAQGAQSKARHADYGLNGRAHWCTLTRVELFIPHAGSKLPARPSARHDGQARLPFDGPCETRRVAPGGYDGQQGVARVRGPERQSMSGPQVIPTLGSLTKAKGDCMCPISPGSIRHASCRVCGRRTRRRRAPDGGCAFPKQTLDSGFRRND